MQDGNTKGEGEAIALREAKKKERRAAMAEFKALHAIDPEKGREAARLWFEQNAEPGEAQDSAFHRRKLSEADPERESKAAEAAKKCEADTERAQNASRATVKQWKKRNPTKVKKLNNAYRQKSK